MTPTPTDSASRCDLARDFVALPFGGRDGAIAHVVAEALLLPRKIHLEPHAYTIRSVRGLQPDPRAQADGMSAIRSGVESLGEISVGAGRRAGGREKDHASRAVAAFAAKPGRVAEGFQDRRNGPVGERLGENKSGQENQRRLHYQHSTTPIRCGAGFSLPADFQSARPILALSPFRIRFTSNGVNDRDYDTREQKPLEDIPR